MKNNRVRIIEDCRKDKNAKGMLGIYEGDFPYMGMEDFVNPRILLDNGDTIWGIECWWEPYEEDKPLEQSEAEVKEFINEYKSRMN
jgi:hypothetical protein